ncbi:hypothetical protein F2P79_002241 [Pimephales promelas]|nr:hypothetical protein F2P79_002241 [Pimephales promelas]
MERVLAICAAFVLLCLSWKAERERQPEKETLDWRYIGPAGDYGQRDHGPETTASVLREQVLERARKRALTVWCSGVGREASA